MQTSLPAPDLPAAIVAEAATAAARLRWRLGLPAADHDDLRQELLADLIRRLPSHDPERGNVGPFVGTVLRHQASRIAARHLRRQQAQGGPLASLDALVGTEPLVETLPDEADAAADHERRIDVARALGRLPRRERLFCVAIARSQVDRLAEQGFGSRATLYRRLRELRHVLAAHGLAA